MWWLIVLGLAVWFISLIIVTGAIEQVRRELRELRFAYISLNVGGVTEEDLKERP